jgi:hypothetical protein
MSAVLAAVFSDHIAADQVRTRLVSDGFPTDRVELTSREELGHAKLVPASSVAEKLSHYFEQLFPEPGERMPVQRLQSAVMEGHAVIAVHPRGDIETGRAVEILNEGDPLEIRAQDLDTQTMEQAASKNDAPALSWIGRVIVAPGARD